MQVGMIGLGKMGANMSERLIRAGHDVVGFDLDDTAVAAAEERGATGAESLEHLVALLAGPRVVWMMVPHGKPVDATIERLRPLLAPGDIVVDGGNSFYKETRRRAAECDAAGHRLVDVGTSGGVWGLTEGYSMMVGGTADAVAHIHPLLESLAPAPDKGWAHLGSNGAGHFAKMVHNGVEYGIMQAYAEGFAIMRAKEEFDFDLGEVGKAWQHGSVIRSWLLDLTIDTLRSNPTMDGIAPYVNDSGEGRWTVFESIDLNVAAPVIALSLMERIGSRDEVGFAHRLVAAMRNQFGGHSVKAMDT